MQFLWRWHQALPVSEREVEDVFYRLSEKSTQIGDEEETERYAYQGEKEEENLTSCCNRVDVAVTWRGVLFYSCFNLLMHNIEKLTGNI